jgi:hypothetical protein
MAQIVYNANRHGKRSIHSPTHFLSLVLFCHLQEAYARGNPFVLSLRDAIEKERIFSCVSFLQMTERHK